MSLDQEKQCHWTLTKSLLENKHSPSRRHDEVMIFQTAVLSEVDELVRESLTDRQSCHTSTVG